MKHRLLYLPIALLFLLSFADCAKKGTPSGGDLDSIPPILVRSNPENYNTNFSGNEIRIYFDEYIKLKNLQQELIISPPLKYNPIITPLSSSKTLRIKILDTLKENTTYSFNFGNSIVDNNEENPFSYFKYVFSTGSYIDSLKLSGNVRDAKLLTPEIPTTVMLYEVNEAFTDSTVFLEKPTYITVTKDSTGTFELTNLKEGNYMLLALKEKTNDYIFQPNNDKIGFLPETVSLPTDSTFTLTLFKEEPLFATSRPSQISKQHILFGFQGSADSLKIDLLSEAPEDFEAITYRDIVKDTLHYWFKPKIETDSLIFKVTNYQQTDTLTVRMRDLPVDSLSLSAINPGPQRLLDSLKIKSITPMFSFDEEKINILSKDSVNIPAKGRLNLKYNLAEISFPKTEDQTYAIEILPGGITDFYGKTNDTLRYTVSTRMASDYGTLSLTLANVEKFPLIVQLVSKKFEVAMEKYLLQNEEIFFDEITPGQYFIRIIYDENENNIWDTGNFLERRPPEEIIYYPSQLDVRANWSLRETFTLK